MKHVHPPTANEEWTSCVMRRAVMQFPLLHTGQKQNDTCIPTTDYKRVLVQDEFNNQCSTRLVNIDQEGTVFVVHTSEINHRATSSSHHACAG